MGRRAPKMTQPLERRHRPGDVFQILESHGRKGWIEAFVLATEIRPWGIRGFVAHVLTHDEQQHAFIRLNWREIEFVGHAPIVPASARRMKEPEPLSRPMRKRPVNAIATTMDPELEKRLRAEREAMLWERLIRPHPDKN